MVREFDSMLIFERPFDFGTYNVYGLLFDGDSIDQKLKNYPFLIKDYINYMVGLMYFLDIGGTTSRDKTTWIMNKHRYDINSDTVKYFCKMVNYFYPMQYKIKYKCYPKYKKKDINDNYIISEDYKLWTE